MPDSEGWWCVILQWDTGGIYCQATVNDCHTTVCANCYPASQCVWNDIETDSQAEWLLGQQGTVAFECTRSSEDDVMDSRRQLAFAAVPLSPFFIGE